MNNYFMALLMSTIITIQAMDRVIEPTASMDAVHGKEDRTPTLVSEFENGREDVELNPTEEEKFEKFMKDFVGLNTTSSVTLLAPRDVWASIFLFIPVPILLKNIRYVCKSFYNLIATEQSLKAKICRYLVMRERALWEKTYGDDAYDCGAKMRSFAPLQLPMMEHDSGAQLDEHLALLKGSHRDIKAERCQRCCNHTILVLTVATCGCGCICCLCCGLIALKNKITRGTCTADCD